MKLTPEQLEAILEIDRNLQIIACAGSGKTEVITRRIAGILHSRPDVKPENIVAFTFTEKAAAAMKVRIANALGEEGEPQLSAMYIGTIHGFCYHLLKKYTRQFQSFRILDTVKSHLFVKRYSRECGMQDLGLEPHPCNVNLFLQCIEKMIEDHDNADRWTQLQRDVLEKYISCLYSHGYLDFSLMIYEALRQIAGSLQVREYLSRIRYLVVDEYQDVNDLQEKLIESISSMGANICVVGDDDQTIYQFRGSNADNMITFAQRYPDVHQVRLEQNFRCVPGVVDIADCVIRNNAKRLPKEMVSAVKAEGTVLRAIRYPSAEAEFDGIAEKIALLHTAGVPYREIAVLVRKGRYIVSASNALERAGIPVEADSAESFFRGKDFSRFVATLQILMDVDKAKLYDCWKDLCDGAAFNMGFRFLRGCARGGNLRLSEIIRGFCERIGFLDAEAEELENRTLALEGMAKILDDYDEIYGDWQISARISGVLRFLGTQAAEEYRYHSFRPRDPELDAVQIMTVHKSKGLEFHSVFLPVLTNRDFPVSNVGGKQYHHVLGGVFEQNKHRYQSDLDQERKLFYVAVTRAKNDLYLTYELSGQPVSVFVKEAAESSFLELDRDDLSYVPKAKGYDFEEKPGKSDEDREAEHLRIQAYWETVRYARKALYDYYGTACHFYPAARVELERLKEMTPDELLVAAGKNGLI